MRLKKLTVRNFKSLRDCEVELDKFNVIIGPNASGKTNLVEVFKLLRKIYVEKDTNPFLEWWGYNNVVWAGKEELPITVGMLFDVEGYDVYFETTFTGTGGSFGILKEVIEVSGYVRIEKEGHLLKVVHDKEWLKMAFSGLEYPTISEFSDLNLGIIREKLPKDLEDASLFEILMDYTSMRPVLLGDIANWKSIKSAYTTIEIPKGDKFFVEIPVMWPRTKILQSGDNEFVGIPVYMELGIEDLYGLEFLKKQLILRQIFIRALKTPQYPRKETILNEDASNLVPLLYNIWLREGRLPEGITGPLSIAFPNTRVFFQLTEDGRVMMKVFENNLELAPPSISDGFYKVLAILTAAYLKPPLLIIDEIENSLHPETLELIIDTLKESESQVIITTHSPVVVDIVEPSDLVLVDKENGETVFKRIKDPEKIKEFLNERGITLSEGWLYGSLFENKEQ
ncbi:AAA family ATPase [Thermococcus thioreducens]|uniref:AAA ATPase domain-containing protein n=1 Tax=Thermococcus thioreducens TaxID=277988 RepID=A0A0Q2MSJ2_9EURY|nr:AAA family ATPase [Thermococcus thioreducens]ASJ12072.1 recombinase RecF [Thermococcus thioreducens]KQH82711.1 recombinase RecF [Thermococcus thioreducens]SEW08918.1 AAA ATPase domain-containing protein [Thermococcus thioreducens]